MRYQYNVYDVNDAYYVYAQVYYVYDIYVYKACFCLAMLTMLMLCL